MELSEIPEPTFVDLAEKRNYIVSKASEDHVKQGIDFYVKGVYKATGKEVNMLFAVKRKKSKKKSKYLDKWTWIEYKNSSSKDGWIYGPAHFIAFERSEDYIVVSRKALLEFLNSKSCRVRWDMKFVATPKEAKYRIYQNPSSGCQITQVLSKDILKITGATIWKKVI